MDLYIFWMCIDFACMLLKIPVFNKFIIIFLNFINSIRLPAFFLGIKKKYILKWIK